MQLRSPHIRIIPDVVRKIGRPEEIYSLSMDALLRTVVTVVAWCYRVQLSQSLHCLLIPIEIIASWPH